ncbi:MAG: 16S rRNA (adenine(1518)-N(6)/adenine(1519)-N(6))-dimethyltransferase RsmA [Desulfobacterota bacterium]|nr:16S rRNA (adenine(1518)-N(6)/adenine(1519)-N(6))-dimethyltransferase RsmA [Thermodesulfobacteriota bacterium]
MTSIRRELRQFGLSPRKGMGQHFLVDRRVLERILRTAEVRPDEVVLEVGPGLGELTLGLARLARRVICVELDSGLAEVLKQKVKGLSNVDILIEDILKTDFEALFLRFQRPLKVVANLPYQISTPLLFRFMESRHLFSDLTLMLQREVVERLVAPPGGKPYGALSVLIQSVSEPSLRFVVRPSAFFPPPKVESAVVRILWKERTILDRVGEEWFRRVVRASFGYRRKTLLNALKRSDLLPSGSIEPRLKAIGIDPGRRPETLTLEEFALLAEGLRGPEKSIEKGPGNDYLKGDLNPRR